MQTNRRTLPNVLSPIKSINIALFRWIPNVSSLEYSFGSKKRSIQGSGWILLRVMDFHPKSVVMDIHARSRLFVVCHSPQIVEVEYVQMIFAVSHDLSSDNNNKSFNKHNVLVYYGIYNPAQKPFNNDLKSLPKWNIYWFEKIKDLLTPKIVGSLSSQHPNINVTNDMQVTTTLSRGLSNISRGFLNPYYYMVRNFQTLTAPPKWTDFHRRTILT